jgi:LAO/AO transport system kinase
MSRLSAEQYLDGIRKGNKIILARAITLIESTLPSDQDLAARVLESIYPYSGKSMRLGITGVPGVGKSTFIEAFGMLLIGQGHKVAVLSIDPSSVIGKGSILGDKTRMDRLSKAAMAYVRPSPSAGHLGGTSQHTREVILLCEAAGFDFVIVETVGVGQSETVVDQMVDFFLLLMLAGAGDELQGIKRGIMELAHAIVINKADGDNKSASLRAKSEYETALHWLPPRQQGWHTPVLLASSIEGSGLQELIDLLSQFVQNSRSQGFFEQRRREQEHFWFQQLVELELRLWLAGKKDISDWLKSAQQQIIQEPSIFYAIRQELRNKLASL